METSQKITVSLRKEDVDKKWWILDVNDMTLGRAASQAAHLLRGKHKPVFTPHVDCGDCVIIINADKIKVRGKREDKKVYFHHTLYPGGAIVQKYKDMMKTKPTFVIEHAVLGMLPKTKLGKKIAKSLRVYSGTKHPHEAQNPQKYDLK